MKKKMTVGTLVALSLLTLSACAVGETSKESPVNKEQKEVSTENLSGFIYQNTKEPLYFAGTMNYVHSLTVKELKEDKGVKQITSEISLYDLVEMADGADSEFYKQNLRYTIDKDSITEHLEQANYDDPKNFVTDKVVLKTPLKQGNKWEQTLLLADGKEYLGETKIEKITGENGKRKVSTVTTITGEGFEEYPNKQYEEKAVYEEGKGLVSFERFYPNEAGGFIFEYHEDERKLDIE